MSSWLPENYEKPVASGGNYMKLQDGANKLRILSAPILGYEYWTDENKPVRLKVMPEESPEDMKSEGKVKHFWAFVVWNYKEKRMQILELTQVSIQGPITDLVNSEDWGNPQEYDLTITKKGQKLDTEYTVQPSPHKAISSEAVQAYEHAKVDLNALFKGEDPFGVKDKSEENPFS
jgi:hypothetical protein